jgi:Zn-dependent protease
MFKEFHIGTAYKIPVTFSSSAIFMSLIWFISCLTSYKATFSHWSVTDGIINALLLPIILYMSVLLHEFGHALVAQSYNISVKKINLMFLGGIAQLEEEPKSPGSAFFIAIAGPCVSVAIFLIFLIIAATLDINLAITKLSVFQKNIFTIAFINLALAIFNLLPLLPLDGGRILNAICWKVFGSERADKISFFSSKIFVGLLIVASIFMMFGFHIPFFGVGLVAGISLFMISLLLLVSISYMEQNAKIKRNTF